MVEDGRVLFAQRNGAWVLRFEGAIRYTMAPAVDTFLDQLFVRADIDSICVDMNPTTAIDSTGIGLLAKIAIGSRRAGCGQPIVFCANADINEILCSICIDRVCAIVPEVPQSGADEAISAPVPTQQQLERTIVAAHRLLVDLSENNRAKFQGVLEAFGRDGAGQTPDRVPAP